MGRRVLLARAFRVLIVVEALSFLFFALLHLGVRIPVGFAVLEEPRRPFAVIVEGSAARVMVVVLGAGLILLLTRPGRAALDLGRRGSGPGRE